MHRIELTYGKGADTLQREPGEECGNVVPEGWRARCAVGLQYVQRVRDMRWEPRERLA